MPSIVEQTPYNESTANGVATVFPYTFQLLDADDLVVYADGVEVPSSDYSVSGVGDQAGGNVTFSVAPANGVVVLRSREIELERDTDYQYNGDLREETIDRDFNRIWQALQGLWSRLMGALRAPYPEQLDELPAAEDRALQLLGFDADGQPIAVAPTSGSAADLALRLADPANVLNGAGMSGFDWALVYAQLSAGWGIRTATEGVNVLRYIPVGEWAAIFNYTSTYDCSAAFQAAVDTEDFVLVPKGLYRIGTTVTPSHRGCHIRGAGWGQESGTRIVRHTDTSFGALFRSPATTTEHTIIEGCKFEDYSGLSDTNTSPLVEIGCNDWSVRNCWFFYGYKQLYCPQGSSNADISGNIFEGARKQGIDTYSAGLLKIVNNTFFKCTGDTSNPSERSAQITLRKDPVYSFGTSDVTIVGNYFHAAIYGAHIHAEGVEGLTICANFFSVPSQIDPGQRDDIYLKDATRVVITGNTSTSVFNDYVTGYPNQRGARYCVNIDTGCSDIQIGPNTFRAGITGTINDPNNSAVIFGSNTGIKLANVTSTDKRVDNYHRRYSTSDLTIGITFGGASTGWVYTAEARLQRKGEQVTGTIQIQITTKGSATGAFLITGLPYTAANVSGLQFVGAVRLNGQNVTPNGSRVIPNTTTCTVDKITAGTSAQLTDADFPAGSSFVTVEINYSVA